MKSLKSLEQLWQSEQILKLEDALQTPADVTKSPSHIVELDGVKVSSYTHTKENLKNFVSVRQ